MTFPKCLNFIPAGLLADPELLDRHLHARVRHRRGVLGDSAAPHTLDIHAQVGAVFMSL